jgi:hypothetical protein
MPRKSSRSCYAPLALVVGFGGGLTALGCGSSNASLFGAPPNGDAGSAEGGTVSAGAAGVTGVAGALPGGSSSVSGAGGSGNAAAGNAGIAGTSASGGSAGASASGGSSGMAPGGAAGVGGVAGSAASGGSGGSAGFVAWPGGNSVATVDDSNVFGTNLSGLFYEPAAGAQPEVLWAVQNGPSTLYRLLWNGSVWTPDSSNKWSNGKTLEYPNAKGGPDSEGVTKAAFGSSGVYVSTERDNDNGDVSRLSVLLFDGTAAPTSVSATTEWNLTADLPKVDPNLGLEAIAWVPDGYLTGRGFIDESTQATYDPSRYANHAGGIFFVGLEDNGTIYGYALNHANATFQRVATIASGNPAIMDLSFDRDVGYLWAACDDTCKGRTNVLSIDTRPGSPTLGKFIVLQGFERPSSMANLNNEGFTVTTESTCQGGFKSVFYSDDGNTSKHSIRRDSIPCGAFL